MVATVSLATFHTDEVRLDPYQFYAELHQRGPLCAVTAGSGAYDYVVHGFDAVTAVLRDPLFRVLDETLMDPPPNWQEHRAQSVFMNSMFFNNGPRHTRMRRTFNRSFTARSVIDLEPAIAAIADELLTRMVDRARSGEVIDVMAEFAFPLPANVMGELLGVPPQDRQWYRPRALALSKLLELGGSTPHILAAADSAAAEITDYFVDLIAARRDQPHGDLISALVTAMKTDDAPLNEIELLANLVVLFNAGFVTTTHLLGNGLDVLLRHPQALADLRAHPESAPDYVEEILRCFVPTHFVVRWAAEDTTIVGTPIAKGSRVLVLLAAANRDPRRFASPDQFDPSRFSSQRIDTLSFGMGAHYCLGAALARLEGQRGLTMLLDRCPQISFATPPTTPRHLVIRGYDELLLRIN